MDYLTGDSTYTSDEKKAVHVILNTREEKTHQLDDLIRKAYTEGNIVYCYDSFKVSEDMIESLIGDIQARMYNNIFTRRLSGTLIDKLASRVFHTNANQLYRLYGENPDFQFFDNSGKFIGDNLSVVTEIKALSKQYITGAELEKNYKPHQQASTMEQSSPQLPPFSVAIRLLPNLAAMNTTHGKTMERKKFSRLRRTLAKLLLRLLSSLSLIRSA